MLILRSNHVIILFWTKVLFGREVHKGTKRNESLFFSYELFMESPRLFDDVQYNYLKKKNVFYAHDYQLCIFVF